jgi:formate hydrogenlyase subunit 3/multisubunit Na+/H+ antiporter MnhD subunit
VLIGTFLAHRWWAVVAIMGVIAAAIYLLWAFQQVFHGEPTEEDTTTRDLGWNERLIVAPLIILIVALGVFPKPVLDRITPSVDQLVIHVDRVTHTRIPAGLYTGSASTSTSTPQHLSGLALADPSDPTEPVPSTAHTPGDAP